MPRKSFVSRALGLILVAATAVGAFTFQRVPGKKLLIGCSADETTAIRFFYNNESDYFHFPLIFRAVERRDPRLNTAPMVAEGRTAYISQTEMQSLLRGLAQLDLPWQESERVEALESFKRLRPWSDSMEILIACSKGTARVKVDPKRICEILKPLDSALKTPRALWEFQRFRVNYRCQVPGFEYGAYPDR